MATAQHWELVKALHSRTQQGKLRWEKGARRDSYFTIFPGYGVSLRKEGADYIVELINSEGDIIDAARDTELVAFQGGQSAFALMKDLFEMARGSAMGVDRAVADILSKLEDM